MTLLTTIETDDNDPAIAASSLSASMVVNSVIGSSSRAAGAFADQTLHIPEWFRQAHLGAAESIEARADDPDYQA